MKKLILFLLAALFIIGFIFLYEFPFSNAKTKTNFKPTANTSSVNKTFGKYPGVKF